MANMLVFAEQRNGQIKRVALEALGAANRLVSEVGGEVAVVLAGSKIASKTEALAHTGVNLIFLAEDSRLAQYSSEAYGSVVADIAKKMDASLILMGATAMGKDLGPKLAARLGSPFAGDCIGLEVDENRCFIATRPMYGGKIISTLISRQPSLQVVTLRPNVFPASSADTSIKPKVEVYPPSNHLSDLAAVVKEIISTAGSKVELTEAKIIVSGGRGLKAPEHFALVEALAEALGAAVGASRAAVDAGWKPHSYQVGLTGKTVSPLLYIACGISGAIQHQAGMSSAKYIVAINKDPNAPIFKIANYGIVGDLFEILPLLTEEVKKMKQD